MPIFNNALAGAAGSGGADSYTIERSLRLNSGDQSKLTKTPSTQGNTNTWTLSWWMKAPEIDSTIFSAGNGNTPGRFSFGTNGNGAFFAGVVDNNSSVFSIVTDAFFRDPSAWYHCCLVCDSTAATQADRFKIIVNGVRQTVTGTLMPQNQNTFVNTTQNHQWSGRSHLNIDFADGYLAEIHFVDGQALDETSFGSFDDIGVWNPKKFAGSHNFTPTVTYPAVYVTSPGTYGTVTDVNTVNGNVFTSAGSAGAGSIKVEFASAITGVTHVKFKGGGYSANAGFSIKVNGSTTHSSLTTNSSYTVRTETLSSATDITSFEIVSGSDGWALGDLQFSTDGTNFTAPSGTAAVIPSAGVNGFYLDFSDNSSNAALGFDANVSGTRYSTFMTGATNTTYPAANMFDGSTSTITLGPNGGGIMTFTPGTAIPYTAAAGGVEVNFHSSSQGDRVRINGGSWYNQTTMNVGGWETVSTGDGSITSMDFQDQASSEAAIRAIRVNGTILTDPSGANDWTVNNLTAVLPTPPFSWDGGTLNLSATGGSGNAGGYKDAYFLLPSTGSHSWDMVLNTDSNTGFWFSDSSSASNTHPNQQSGNFVGLRNNGSGTASTGGSGFGSGSPSMPSDAMDGDPRWYFTIDRSAGSGTVKAGLSGTSYSFTIPTTGNVYFHVNAYGAYAFDLGSGSPSDIDSLIDSPTNYDDDTNIGGNYCTWNPLDSQLNASASVANGNLEHSSSTNASYFSFSAGTVGFKSDSSTGFYFEVTQKTYGDQSSIGLHDLDYPVSGLDYGTWIGSGSNSNGISYTTTGTVYNFGTTISSQGTYTNNGDVIGIAVKDNKIWFSKNGTWISGNPSTGASPTATLSSARVLTPIINGYSSGVYALNAGQRPFSQTVPTGFKSLCTQNLDDPLIAKPSTMFDVKTFTANNGSQSISLDFSPDLVWTKSRSSYEGQIFDRVRGDNEELVPSSSAGGRNLANSLTFDSSGFTMPSNNNNANYGSGGSVAWAWNAGDSNTSVSTDSLTNSIYNSSQTWSTYGTASGTQYGSYVWADVFDNLNDSPQNVGNCVYGPTYKWTFTNPVSVSSSVALAVWGIGTVTLNAGESDAVTLTSAGNSYNTVSTTSLAGATLKNIQLDTGTAVYLFSVTIDGARLVDPNIAPSTPSIASTYRANPSAGFSIVTWTGTGSAGTLAHGLQKKPELIITKVYSSNYTDNWPVYHPAYGAGTYTYLNDGRAAPASYTGFFNGVEPTSSVFSVGSANSDNTKDLLAYCFTSVENYSAIGSYTGNGSTDGPFVHTGFRPAFILLKNITDASTSWTIHDDKRLGYNPDNDLLFADTSDAENATSYLDILSNGFKLRISSGFANASTKTYIYAAFASNPFKTGRAR